MPKAKKIAPSPSGAGTPYQTFPLQLPSFPDQSGESSSSRGREKTRVYTPRACQNCQVKKTKCSGQPAPCNRCAAEEVECNFDRTTDQRRRETSGKKEAETQNVKRCLDQLMELLGGTNEQKLGRVREMVREGVGWKGVQDFLDSMKSASSTEGVNAEPSTTASGQEREPRSERLPIDFDEWIAEVFGSPEQRDDNLEMG